MIDNPPAAHAGAEAAPTLVSYVPRIHREGWPFVAAAGFLAFVLAVIAAPLGWIGLIATGAVALFFRDPDRMTPLSPDLVVAPADGRVTAVAAAAAPAELGLDGATRLRISIFLSILDVHINRLPVDGSITTVAYRPGTFVNAALDKASEQNERNGLVIATPAGQQVAVVQIAGLIARRIRCWVRTGEPATAGRRFGLIRFGSRVDVYLPDSATPLVAEGQRTLGGETILADLAGRTGPWRAERR